MIINSANIVSITEANQNFSKVARLVDEMGEAIIFKNNRPKYKIVELTTDNIEIDLTEDEIIEIYARRILNKHKNAFMELAK